VAAGGNADGLHQHGHRRDLTKATKIAIQQMVDFLAATKGLDKLAAYQLTSIAGNVVITQLVDQKVGVHVKMPKGIFK
jgi:acetamidase/formamidase